MLPLHLDMQLASFLLKTKRPASVSGAGLEFFCDRHLHGHRARSEVAKKREKAERAVSHEAVSIPRHPERSEGSLLTRSFAVCASQDDVINDLGDHARRTPTQLRRQSARR